MTSLVPFSPDDFVQEDSITYGVTRSAQFYRYAEQQGLAVPEPEGTCIQGRSILDLRMHKDYLRLSYVELNQTEHLQVRFIPEETDMISWAAAGMLAGVAGVLTAYEGNGEFKIRLRKGDPQRCANSKYVPVFMNFYTRCYDTQRFRSAPGNPVPRQLDKAKEALAVIQHKLGVHTDFPLPTRLYDELVSAS